MCIARVRIPQAATSNQTILPGGRQGSLFTFVETLGQREVFRRYRTGSDPLICAGDLTVTGR